jgi:regulator of sirC expression with transglutaminase-like and TPR domain
VDSKAGIPITLALVYMMVGSRAGMRIEGINLPGHFIARHAGVFFDPFHAGRILTLADVKHLLVRQNLEFKESHLLPATPRQFLLRMLANLLYVYDLDGEDDKRDRVKGWMDAISYYAVAE